MAISTSYCTSRGKPLHRICAVYVSSYRAAYTCACTPCTTACFSEMIEDIVPLMKIVCTEAIDLYVGIVERLSQPTMETAGLTDKSLIAWNACRLLALNQDLPQSPHSEVSLLLETSQDGYLDILQISLRAYFAIKSLRNAPGQSPLFKTLVVTGPPEVIYPLDRRDEREENVVGAQEDPNAIVSENLNDIADGIYSTLNSNNRRKRLDKAEGVFNEFGAVLRRCWQHPKEVICSSTASKALTFWLQTLRSENEQCCIAKQLANTSHCRCYPN